LARLRPHLHSHLLTAARESKNRNQVLPIETPFHPRPEQRATAIEALLRLKVITGFVVAALLTSLMGFLSWRNTRLAADDADWVAHTYAVLGTLDATVRHTADVETSARGFALTGEEPLLAPFERAQPLIGSDLETLRHLTADNPTQQQRLDALEPEINAALAFSKRAVTQRRQTRAAPPPGKFQESKQLMDTVRATIQDMRAEETGLLDQRTGKAKAAKPLTRFITVIGAIFGVAFLGLAWFAINREIGVSARAREEISALNAELEQRVEQRTTALQSSEREVHELNDELEKRVIQRTAQLQVANQELEAFTYSVSHDLRAPLRHISGFSKILVEEFGSTLDPEAQRYLQRIQESTTRMGVLVDDLLNLARLGRKELRRQVTGLDSVVQEVISDLKPESDGRQVEWKVSNLPFVECDPSLIKQVMQNLLSNALKYSRPRISTLIEVGQKQENEQLVVFVRDNGVGFSMKYADKLFGVFQRLHRSEDFEGTGVGLATVQRIIHKHGGRVWAEAELDKGATFYFTIGIPEPTQSKSQAAAAGGES
jgi:signal transduction histidine kinase